MWLIRIHKIETKDYNYIKRVFDKMWFFPKKIPQIIFVKALFFHLLQNKSWRNIATILNCNYLSLFNFYSNYKENEKIYEILYYFAERRIIVFIWKQKNFTNDDLDNNNDFLEITKFKISEISKKV